MKTEAMKEREQFANVTWIDAGEGFFIGKGDSKLGFALCYIALPENHKDNNKNYADFDVNVNGGLTFGEGNVYGWDYGHALNSFNYEEDFEEALKFFRNRKMNSKKVTKK